MEIKFNQQKKDKTGILVVSFGTSYEDTRRQSIDLIEAEIWDAYPQCNVYSAWTSGMIIRKVLERDGLNIFHVKEALEQMKADRVTDLTVQPTHVINSDVRRLLQSHVAATDFVCMKKESV